MVKNISPKNWRYGSYLFVLFSFVYCYMKVVKNLLQVWSLNDTYSYGFFIPMISLYLLWERREKLTNSRREPDYLLGVPILAFALVALIVGDISGVVLIRDLSILIAIIGLVLYLFGTNLFRNAWFPIVYLIFMIPVWDFILDVLHFPFQLISAKMGIEFLHIIGIPAYRSGIYIELPNITLEVAEACSGINYLVSIVAIGIPLSYLYLKNNIKRVIIISTSVIIALISNGIRVTLIGVFAYYGYRELHGPFAIFRAVVISSFGIIVLFILVWFFSDKNKNESVTVGTDRQVQKCPKGKNLDKNNLPILPLLILVVPFILVGSYINFHKPSIISLQSDYALFPVKLGIWSGINTNPDFPIFKELGVDQELSRRYRSSSGRYVNFYMGYFEFQRQNKELINYKLNEILKKKSNIKINTGDGKIITVNKFIKKDENSKKLVLYWYDINGRILTSKYLVKLYTVWDGIINNRTNGSVIIITTEIGNEDDIDGPLVMAQSFIRDIYPHLYNYLPRN
ncbi:MAG: exosortase W [Candidatus Thorarchaeota archaeon]